MYRPLVRPTSTSPRGLQMSQGHRRTPVRRGRGPCAEKPPLTGQPEGTWPEALRPPAAGTASQIASCPLAPGVTAPGGARDFTRQILGSWGLLVLAGDATVIVSELVTNALRHGAHGTNGPVCDGSGHDRIELTLLRQPAQMVCAVTDPGAEPPIKAAPDPSAEAGRGLHGSRALPPARGGRRVG